MSSPSDLGWLKLIPYAASCPTVFHYHTLQFELMRKFVLLFILCTFVKMFFFPPLRVVKGQ